MLSIYESNSWSDGYIITSNIPFTFVHVQSRPIAAWGELRYMYVRTCTMVISELGNVIM